MNNKINIKTIFRLILEKKPALVYGQIVTFLAIFVSIPIPLMLPLMVDEVLLNKPAFFVTTIDTIFGSGSPLYYISIVTLVVISLRFSFYFLGVITTKIFTKISKYVTFSIRERLIKHLQVASMNEYETLGSGAITSNLVTDINTLDIFIMSSASKFVASVLTLLGVGIVMIVINPILGVLILLIQPMIMLISRRMSKKVGVLKKRENEAVSDFQENIAETLELFGQIKASNKEKFFFTNAVERAKNIQTTSNEFNFKSVAYEKLSYTIFLSVFELLRASGLILVAYSDLSIGMMFAMFGYIWFIMTPVQEILSMQYSYSSAMAALERINKVLALKTEKSGEKILDKKELNISLNNLSFSYATGDKKILKDISLDINAGSKIALIGASGSGKTTLAQVISGFYEKSSGEIYYNSLKTEDLNKHSLRKSIFLVYRCLYFLTLLCVLT